MDVEVSLKLNWIGLKLVFSRQGERLLWIMVGTWWIRYGFYGMFRWVSGRCWYFFGWIRERVGWDGIGCLVRMWEVGKVKARNYWVWSKVFVWERNVVIFCDIYVSLYGWWWVVTDDGYRMKVGGNEGVVRFGSGVGSGDVGWWEIWR